MLHCPLHWAQRGCGVWGLGVGGWVGGWVGQNKHEKEKRKGLALCIHPTPSIYLILHYAKSFAVNENSEEPSLLSFVMWQCLRPLNLHFTIFLLTEDRFFILCPFPSNSASVIKAKMTNIRFPNIRAVRILFGQFDLSQFHWDANLFKYSKVHLRTTKKLK